MLLKYSHTGKPASSPPAPPLEGLTISRANREKQQSEAKRAHFTLGNHDPTYRPQSTN